MSFFKNAMANVLGIGGAKVDTILDKPNASPGDTVTGIIKIYGGKIEQTINAVNLVIKTTYEKETKDKKIMVDSTIQKIPIAIGRSLLPDEDLQVPFSFVLAENCPISTYRFPIKIHTNLDIANAIDSSDGDIIKVDPENRMQSILNIMGELGFKIREIENIPSLRRVNNLPFVQEFEFVPHTGEYLGLLDEIEIIFSSNMYGIDLYMQIDRKVHSIGSFLAEALNLDESFVKLELTHEDLKRPTSIYNRISTIISRNI